MKKPKFRLLVLMALIFAGLVLATMIALRWRAVQSANEKAAALEQNTSRVLRAIRPDTKPAKFPK